MTIPASKKPIILSPQHTANSPSESFPNPITNGDVSWRTLISAPKTASDTFTVGIATCPPGASSGCGGSLKSHRHKHAEIYHVMQGSGRMTIDGQEHDVTKGSVVWIPGDAEHAIENVGQEELAWLYVFAADGFEEIVYRFSEPVVERLRARL